MERTVFAQREQIPVIVVTRGTGDMVDPSDPAFGTYGSFRVTDNQQKIVKDYAPEIQAIPITPLNPRDMARNCASVLQAKATKPLFNRPKDATEITLLLEGGDRLPVGEYNVTFRYLDQETPSIAFEVYPPGKLKRAASGTGM